MIRYELHPIRLQRLRVNPGQNGRWTGTLLCPREGRFIFEAWGTKWDLPYAKDLRPQLWLAAQPGQQRVVTLSAQWDRKSRGGRLKWDVTPRGNPEAIPAGRVTLFDLVD